MADFWLLDTWGHFDISFDSSPKKPISPLTQKTFTLNTNNTNWTLWMKAEQQQPDRLLLHTRWPWHMDAGLSGEEGRVIWAYLVFDNSRRYFIEKEDNQLSFITISWWICGHWAVVQVLCSRLSLWVQRHTDFYFIIYFFLVLVPQPNQATKQHSLRHKVLAQLLTNVHVLCNSGWIVWGMLILFSEDWKINLTLANQISELLHDCTCLCCTAFCWQQRFDLIFKIDYIVWCH